jgi:hypothetical protein
MCYKYAAEWGLVPASRKALCFKITSYGGRLYFAEKAKIVMSVRRGEPYLSDCMC